jgi:GTPase SAR1 family protein
MLNLFFSEIVYTVNQVEAQEAVFWFPFIFAGALLVGTVAVIASSESTDTKRTEGKSLGILGMPGAGKTLFLRNLQGKPYTRYEQTTGAEDYNRFDFTHKGRTISICEGKDIGGNAENIKVYYEDFLKNKDICLFIFDIKKYIDIEQEKYRNDVNARLDYIDRHIKDMKHWAIIGTHVDQAKIEQGKSIIDIVQRHVKNKPYSRLLSMNFFARNLTNKKDMDFIIDKIF